MVTGQTFNPVKADSGDVRAKRAIWTTKSIQLALDGLKAGKRLTANPFYDNNVKLLKGDLVFQRTEEEIAEWKKCASDVVYFVETYCKFLTPQGIKNVQLRDYQKKYLKHLSENNLSIYLACRQCAKTTTTGAFLLHYVCFNVDKNTMVVGNKRKTAVEILDKLKKMFVELPYFLKPGIYKWNDAEISFDNICRVQAEATTINSGIGQTLSLCLWDEAAHVAPNIIDKFYNNIFPTITAANAKFYISSTQNGRNLFYRLYTAAVQKDSDFRAFKTDWDEVPDWNPETQQWEKRDEAWHQRQVANYGSEEAFNSQFGTNFDISSNTLISQKKLKETPITKFIIKDIYGVPYADRWYWHPNFDPMTDLRKSYIITTCDLAEGIGQDYTVFSIFRMVNPGTDDLECIGYFRSNELNRERCAESLMSLYIKWCHPDRSLVSFERNTYGEIFLKDINDLANKTYPEWDPGFMVKYYTESGTKFHYGIKITSGNKTTHCVIFKESFERGKTIYEAEQFVYELQNFSDDGTGHYKASFGHDDMIMTAVQLEFVRKELQYRMLRDDFESGQSCQEDTIWNPYDSTPASDAPMWPSGYIPGMDDMNSLNRLQGNG